MTVYGNKMGNMRWTEYKRALMEAGHQKKKKGIMEIMANNGIMEMMENNGQQDGQHGMN